MDDLNSILQVLVLLAVAALGVKVRPGQAGPAMLRAFADSLDLHDGRTEARPGTAGALVIEAIEQKLRAGVRAEMAAAMEPIKAELARAERRTGEHSRRLATAEREIASMRGFLRGKHGANVLEGEDHPTHREHDTTEAHHRR